MFRNNNDNNVAFINSRYTAGKRSDIRVVSQGFGTGSSVTNELRISVADDGTRTVGVTEAAPWRAALGLGTSGALPITVAQGGTGVTTATKNYVFAAPSGSNGAPSFRELVAADIPNLSASKITSGSLAAARGGTGVSLASPNTVFAGPTGSVNAAPSFRDLVAADIPNLNASKITAGTLSIARGGSGQTEVTSVETISSIATAGSGCTITAAHYVQWGKVAQVFITATKTAAATSVTSVTLATLVSGKRPAINTGAMANNANAVYSYVGSNGNCVVRGTFTAN